MLVGVDLIGVDI